MPASEGRAQAAGFSAEAIGPQIIPADAGRLADDEVRRLWELFQQIGRVWKNVWNDSAGQRSSWLEFLVTRCLSEPSYVEEYRSALRVLDELLHDYGNVEAYRRLLLDANLADGTERKPTRTRLDHAKVFVVNEFMRVQIVAGGFRGFGTDDEGRPSSRHRAYNYNGFVRGSRYNRVQRVRAHRPPGDAT